MVKKSQICPMTVRYQISLAIYMFDVNNRKMLIIFPIVILYHTTLSDFEVEYYHSGPPHFVETMHHRKYILK